MHISLPIRKETTIMGSDTGGEWASNLTRGNNFSISVNTNSVDEATRIFNALVEGGTITIPLNKTFWNVDRCFWNQLDDKLRIGIS